jgi:hypothetical protein
MTLELELSIDFGAAGNSQTYLGAGWAMPEPAFTWAVGMESHLRIPVDWDAGAYVLTLDLVPFVHCPGMPAQRLIVSINDVVVGSAACERPTLLGYCIPADLACQSGQMRIALQHPDAATPSEFQISDDQRVLAVSLTEARLYRVGPVIANDSPGQLPAGVMISGSESETFGIPRPRDLASWVAARTGLDMRTLALRFESVGENCEFGLVQRQCEAEPLGLLRFSSTFLRPLIRGLDTGFDGLGHPADIVPRLEGKAPREFMIHEGNYGLVYHSFVYEGQRSDDLMRQQEAVRLKFLRRKFMEELGAADKIFVYKRNANVPPEEILPLFLALRRHGDNTLLWVVPAERDRPAGTVEVMMPGLLKGYIDRFAPENNAHDFSFGAWMKVCANALVLSGLRAGRA